MGSMVQHDDALSDQIWVSTQDDPVTVYYGMLFMPCQERFVPVALRQMVYYDTGIKVPAVGGILEPRNGDRLNFTLKKGGT